MSMVKLPSMSVIVPVEVPFTNTEAPISTSPVDASVTVPLTLLFWAKETMGRIVNNPEMHHK
jgi:hypothetical protein